MQIVHSQYRGSRDIEHIGSGHTDVDLEVLKAVARQQLAAGQDELDLRLPDSPARVRRSQRGTTVCASRQAVATALTGQTHPLATASGPEDLYRGA